MIRFSKKGITFDYNNDEITWFWWWARTSKWPFYSLIYGYDFKSFKQYWMKVGSVSEQPTGLLKLRGLRTEELIRAWAKFHCRSGYYVVLYDIDLEAKPASFWRSIPDRDKVQLMSDAVVLRCKDADEACNLCETLDNGFAKALAFNDGYAFYWSVDDVK